MTTPSLSAIVTHYDLHGGLWLIIPAPTPTGQPEPLFAVLGVAQGALGPFRTYRGGDLAATIESSPALQGAEWAPVTSRGERL